MPEPRLAVLFLPPLPAGVLAGEDMPFLGHLAAEGIALPFVPEPLGATRQRLLGPMEGSGVRISALESRAEGGPRKLSGGVTADWVPRRAFFRPLRRWIGRRWQGYPLFSDPAFVPAVSLAYLNPVSLLDPDDNLFTDLEDAGITATCSMLDYPWLSSHEGHLTWLDDAHERDYVAWILAALSSPTRMVCLEMGHRLGRCVFRRPVGSPRVGRLTRRLDRQLKHVLAPGPVRRSRQVLAISPETPAAVEASVDLAGCLEREHFQPGRHYVAVIHPTFAQLWATDRETRDYLKCSVADLRGVILGEPWALLPFLVKEDRRWGDWLAVVEPGVVFHPNHIDGRTRRRMATGWLDRTDSGRYGFALFHGPGWELPQDPPPAVGTQFVRRVLLDTVGFAG